MRRIIARLVALVAVVAAGVAVGTPALAAPGFVGASGTSFTNNGEPFRFIGFDAYGMAGCYDGSPWTTDQLDAYFSQLPANGVTRVWAFHRYGTAPIQRIVAEAAKYGRHVILTLGDDDSNCGESDGAVQGAGSGKTREFYTSGWQATWLEWVNTIVPLFRDDPTVMMWETANEPGQAGYRPTPAEMLAYVRGTSDAIRALDPNHLISVGANFAGNFGGRDAYRQVMTLPNIDAVSFHDYSYEYENGVIVSGNFKTAEAVSAAVGKPFYGGEAGAPAGVNCSTVQGQRMTLGDRATFLGDKTTSYFAEGIGGLLFWQYERSRASWVGPCAYEMYPTDPMVTFVRDFTPPA